MIEKRMNWMLSALLLSCLGLATPPKAGAAVTFTLLNNGTNPGSAITGAPGTTVGWGIDITSDTYWMIVTSVQSTFTQFPGGLSSSATTPVEDYLSFYFANNGTTVSPGNPFSQAFLQGTPGGTGTGLGAFSIRNDAVLGTPEIATIQINYVLFDADPNGAGLANQVDEQGQPSSAEIVASLGASVTAISRQTAVPEPGTTLLLGFGLAQLAALGYLRRRS